jgi:hypothetical protein
MNASLKYNKNKFKHEDFSSPNSLKELELNIEKLDRITSRSTLPLSQDNNELNYYEYRVDYPAIYNDHKNIESKKYIGLMFYETENIDDSCTENNNNEKYHIFLETNGVYIINYSIVLSINKINELNENNKYSVFLGTKKKNSQKINVIKGSKISFDANYDENSAKITINNTIIYYNKDESELYIIAQLDKNCAINSKKSYLKILKNK